MSQRVSLLRVIRGSAQPAPWNMAFDEAMLLHCAVTGPLLRFYGWTEPAASFGYFQKVADIEATTPLRPLVRRPTGGGLVPHDADWTYSLAFPPQHEWYEISAAESYRRVHEWLRHALAQLGVEAHLAPCCSKPVQGQCFIGYEKYDLLSKGSKIAGAAQRRNRSGLLIQGSLQPNRRFNFPRERWEQAMPEHGVRFGLGSHEDWEPELEFVETAKSLVREKYSQESYNRKR